MIPVFSRLMFPLLPLAGNRHPEKPPAPVVEPRRFLVVDDTQRKVQQSWRARWTRPRD